jgi:hypothetical protein
MERSAKTPLHLTPDYRLLIRRGLVDRNRSYDKERDHALSQLRMRRFRKAGMSREPWVTATISMR